MVRVFCWFFLFCLPFVGECAPITEGKDYVVMRSASFPVENTGVAEVTEFFSYGCPWCFKLETPLTQWLVKHQKAVHFTKVPVVFHPEWDYYARAYYIIDTLSLGKPVQDALFNAIITDKKPLHSKQAMMAFFKEQGVDTDIVASSFANAPSIQLRLKTDQNRMAAFQVRAVPAFVINNRYKTDLQMAQTEAHLFEVLDFLLKKTQ